MTSIHLATKVDNWDNLLGQTRTRVGQIVRKTALDAQAVAQQAAPVDSGALRASIYTVSPGASGAGASAAAVAATGAKGKAPEQFPAYEVSGAFQAAVVVGASYGYFVEFGTTRRPARPFLTPALAAQEGPFLSALQGTLGGASAGVNFQVSEDLPPP